MEGRKAKGPQNELEKLYLALLELGAHGIAVTALGFEGIKCNRSETLPVNSQLPSGLSKSVGAVQLE